MIKTLLFDNNGVITTDNEEEDLAALFGVSLEEFKTPHAEIHPEYAVGNISVEEYCKRHGAAFDSNHDIQTIKQAHFESYLLIPGMKELLGNLKQKYEIALLTNFGDGFEEANLTWKLEDVFEKDKLFVSHKIGLQKPDPNCFLHVLNELGKKPEEVIFIDDRETNVGAAISVGMKGIVFTTRENFENDLKSLVDAEKENV